MTQLGINFEIPAQRHSPTSVAAADRIKPTAGTSRARVLEAIEDAYDGLTDEEGIAATGMSASTYRPRRVELAAAGLIVSAGDTRDTASGRAAQVWRAAQ